MLERFDDIQRRLHLFLRGCGFRVRGRTFNRGTKDNLTQVINIQMGPSDPPGTAHIPGLRENLHGLFTVNLGIYVPEVARNHGGREAPSWVQAHHCCIRARLGEAFGNVELWWHARYSQAVIDDVRRQLEAGGLAFLGRYSTRDKILAEWRDRSENMGASDPPRIVMAIILAERGQLDRATELLAKQVLESRNPGHPEYVRALAYRLGLGALESRVDGFSTYGIGPP